MKVPVLGTLRSHQDIPEWLISDPIGISYFDGQKLPIIVMMGNTPTSPTNGIRESDAGDVQSAIANFLNLGTNDRLLASEYVFANYRKIAELVDDDLGCQIATKEKVWEHVHPSEIYILKRNTIDRAIFVQIVAECDWEPEHGLQIVYRLGRELSHVNQQGHW